MKINLNKQLFYNYISAVDALRNMHPQYVVKELGVIPVDPKTFNESTEKTAYVQKTSVTARLIYNTPATSVININNKEPSTLLPKVDTPLDEKF